MQTEKSTKMDTSLKSNVKEAMLRIVLCVRQYANKFCWYNYFLLNVLKRFKLYEDKLFEYIRVMPHKFYHMPLFAFAYLINL